MPSGKRKSQNLRHLVEIEGIVRVEISLNKVTVEELSKIDAIEHPIRSHLRARKFGEG